MKRGFLKSKKVQREALYPIESSSRTAANLSAGVAAGVAISAADHESSTANPVATKSEDRKPDPETVKPLSSKVENTALPTMHTPNNISAGECDFAKVYRHLSGLLITATPAYVAGSLPDPDGYSQWIVNAQTMKKVLNTPGYPQPVPKFTQRITVKSTLSMGKGVFATHDIQPGVIFAERPLLVVSTALLNPPTMDIDLSAHKAADLVNFTQTTRIRREQRLESAVGRMEPSARAKFMALVNNNTEAGHIHGIIRTNGYEVDNLWDGDIKPDDYDQSNRRRYSAVCEIGSRINHSCVFNVLPTFKLSACAMIFVAVRHIKSGEQLFSSYCGGGEQSAAERKAELEPYGFTQCTCAPCVNATPETDTFRKTFQARVEKYDLNGGNVAWAKLRALPAGTLDELLAFQRLVVQEGFDIHDKYWLMFMPTLALAYRMAGRLSEARAVMQQLRRWRTSGLV